MLPMWLGTDAVLAKLREDASGKAFDALMEWPFFRMQIDGLEALLAKTDLALVDFYAERLTPRSHRAAHDAVRRRAAEIRDNLLALRRQQELLADNPRAQYAIRVRNTYLDPLHLLQGELIGRLRENYDDQVAEALKITMAGIATGPAPHGLRGCFGNGAVPGIVRTPAARARRATTRRPRPCRHSFADERAGSIAGPCPLSICCSSG